MRITISEHLQTKNWSRLLRACDTSDSEVAKSIAMIFSLHSPGSVWPLIDYTLRLSAEDRRAIRNSIATLCYAIGRLEQPDLRRSVSALRGFLSEDHMLLDPVVSALSNFWVIKPKLTAGLLYKKWILQHHEENDDLSFAAVSSCKYMYQNSPESVTPFLEKVVRLSYKNPMFTSCSSIAKEIAPNITADVISKDARGSRYKRKGREMRIGKRKKQH